MGGNSGRSDGGSTAQFTARGGWPRLPHVGVRAALPTLAAQRGRSGGLGVPPPSLPEGLDLEVGGVVGMAGR